MLLKNTDKIWGSVSNAGVTNDLITRIVYPNGNYKSMTIHIHSIEVVWAYIKTVIMAILN